MSNRVIEDIPNGTKCLHGTIWVEPPHQYSVPNWDALHNLDVGYLQMWHIFRWPDASWVPLLSVDSTELHLILRTTPTPRSLSSSPGLYMKIPLIAKHRLPAHTANTWAQLGSQDKFHSTARWNYYQYMNLHLAHLTVGKWTQLLIAMTVIIVWSFSQSKEKDPFRDWFS